MIISIQLLIVCHFQQPDPSEASVTCRPEVDKYLQVPIFELLKKFDSERVHDDIKLGRRRYRITKLPQYLVLHVKRFLSNRYFTEKNPTIVNFPVKNLELRDIIPVPKGGTFKFAWRLQCIPFQQKVHT